jgi:hypothetical protein
MAEFEVLGKVQRLGHGNVTIVLEHHHGHGFARNHVTNDELGQYVQPELNVGDTLNKSNGYEPDDGEKEADDKSPRRETCWPGSHNTKGDANHDDEQSWKKTG